MRHGPALLRGAAAALWAVTVLTAFTGFDDHLARWSALDERMWTCALCGALMATLAANVAKGARLYTEMTRAAITRPPLPRGGTGPMRILPAGPLRILPDRHPARHAHRAP